MKTSTEMFAYNIALNNVLEMFDCNVTLNDLCHDIDFALELTFKDMEYWVDRNMTQFNIAEIQCDVYQRVVNDIDFYIMYKRSNPSLAQTQIGYTLSIVKSIYKMF